ncbi:MAG: Flp family type IVb pilin [Aestuariivirga sp.]
MNKLVRFVKDESGATAIEYGLIAAAMGIAIITAMPSLTSAWQGNMGNLAGNM